MLPSAGGAFEEWARVAAAPCCRDRRVGGPAVGDQVLVVFEGGDPARPYVIGALWGGGAPPPETGPIALRLPTGASLRGFVNPGEPSATCDAPGSLLDQSASWLASMQSVLPVLRLLQALVKVIEGLPAPSVAARQRFSQAAAELAPALLSTSAVGALPLVRDLLCVVLRSLQCRVETRAEPNAMDTVVAIQGLLDLARPFFEIAGVQPVRLAAVSNLQALPDDIIRLTAVAETLGGCGD